MGDLAQESPQLLLCVYLGDFERHLLGVLLVKLLPSVSFEVNGIYKDQNSVWVHHVMIQQVFKFI